MSTITNEDYNINNSSINIYIDNIVSFRDFLNAILTDIKSGEYNIHMIKNLSQTVEKFYNNISDNIDNISNNSDNIDNSNNKNSTDSKQLVPKTVVTYQYSDSEDTESEDAKSVISVMSSSDLENAGSIKKSAYSIVKFLSHKPYDVPNDNPDFLEEHTSPTKSKNISLHSSFTRTQEPKVVEYNYYQSLFEQHKQEVNENKVLSDEPPCPSGIIYKKTNIDSFIPFKPKNEDKLALAFLNNNLELNKYHYLKNFNQSRVNNFCVLSYIY